MRTSQKQNILRHLLYGPLCGQEADWTLGRRIPARIHELRQAGFIIEKRRCDQGHDHRTYQIEFYLWHYPAVRKGEYADWCAHCGGSGGLMYASGESTSRLIDGKLWLATQCSVCGKGDWR